jgi:hypothetical protein
MRDRLTQELVTGLPIDGRDRLISDALLPGFGIRVTPAGRKIFVAQARVGGQLRRVPIGRFPEKSVAQAREAARIALDDLYHVGLGFVDAWLIPTSAGIIMIDTMWEP